MRKRGLSDTICCMDEPMMFKPEVFHDERGFFLESFKQSDFFDTTFMQENHSFSHKGVLRGMHYQRGQAKHWL